MLWRPLPWLRFARAGYTARHPCRGLLENKRFGRIQKTELSSKAIPLLTHAQLLQPTDLEEQAKSKSTNDIKVAGTVRSARWKKSIVFAHIHDGTTYDPLQAILPIELATGNVSNGAYVELTGKWQPSPARGQSHELHVTAVDNVGLSDALEHPIQKASMTPQYLRTVPHMRVRTPIQALLARARSQLISSISQQFNSQSKSVIQVHPPLITSSDCEGAGEVFTVSAPKKSKEDTENFFKEPKYLTVSSQLHLEAWSADLGDVWALSPTFRAEESDTGRHLAEFYMLEAEFRSTLSLESIMSQVQALIGAIATDLSNSTVGQDLLRLYADRSHRPEDSEHVGLQTRWTKVGSSDDAWLRVTYADAMQELVKAQGTNSLLFKNHPQYNDGLALEHERWIVENISHGMPTFVTHYPAHLKPFYMLPSTASDLSSLSKYSQDSPDAMASTVACFDLLLPHGYAEVAGGSLREHRLEHLISAMRRKGLLKKAASPEESEFPHLHPGESLGNLQWYADLRRFGSSPHGGFGLGFDRLLAYLTGVGNVRDAVGFPRYWGSCRC